jgi:ketosteroid isomerase-like protein
MGGKPMDTKAIMDHQSTAFVAGSADEILADFADDAVLIVPEGVHRGRAAIHAVYSDLFSGLFKPETYDFTMIAEVIEGDVAYIAWRASCATAEIPLGTDTYVVRNGKIVAQTMTTKIDPK